MKEFMKLNTVFFSFWFVICLFKIIHLSAYDKLNKPRHLRTSIIIPCHYKHAEHLNEALEKYAAQTAIPDEVVVSLSEAQLVPDKLKDDLQNKKWPFKFVLLQHNVPVSEGGNRNKACKASTGDILICSDADDLPHWQRVEIIKYFFENYPIDFLIHTFTFDASTWTWIDPTKIEHTVPNYVNEGGPHANGAVAISRKLSNLMKWNAEFRKCVDADFNGSVYWTYPSRMLIKQPIYLYRNYLSVYPQDQ
jgi:hypothetical protein